MKCCSPFKCVACCDSLVAHSCMCIRLLAVVPIVELPCHSMLQLLLACEQGVFVLFMSARCGLIA